MHLFMFSTKQAVILLAFFLQLSSTILALPFDPPSAGIVERGAGWSCCGGDEADDGDDNDGDCEELPLTPIMDGPTSDKSAGLGVEFETTRLRFESKSCSPLDTNQAKGQVVDKREGTNWRLTADVLDKGLLSAEYIIDGEKVKLGSGAAATAATAISNDITSWNPSADMTNNKVNIPKTPCNPWDIIDPETGGKAADIGWGPQITAPLPLKAINDLFGQRTSDQRSALLPSRYPNQNMVMVTKDFFQASPNGISSDSVGGDVLGFFSLVMSYAKAADKLDDESPKTLMSIMPRTDFSTMFKLVKSDVPGTLYDIVKTLSCYKNSGNKVELDSTYCSGTVESPHPNGKMDDQTFSIEYRGKHDSTTVKEWMESIQDGKSPDRVSEVDKVLNGQVGGLKGALENVLDTSKAAPLFEFRRLKAVKTNDIKSFVNKAEDAVVELHRKYK